MSGEDLSAGASLGSLDNPIRCNGVEGEHDYLRGLVGPSGAL